MGGLNIKVGMEGECDYHSTRSVAFIELEEDGF